MTKRNLPTAFILTALAWALAGCSSISNPFAPSAP